MASPSRETSSASAGSDEAPPSLRSNNRSAALTKGPVGKTLLLFSLPILASSVLQSLNASINAVWIGRLLGEEALTASANANTLLFFLLGSVFGLGLAASVLIGQSLGANDRDLAKRTVGTSLVFFVLLALVIALGGFILAPHMLVAMHTPSDALPYASAYLRVIFVALPGMYLYTFVMMILRGAGDARTPFIFLAVSAVLDVGLNPVLIRGLGPIPALGITGSALATFIAQWLALLGLIIHLYRKKHFLRIARGDTRYLRIDGVVLRALIQKGVPMGLQMVVMSASMIAIIRLVNRYGSTTTAAYGACFQLWNYIQMPAMAIGSAVSSIAAQSVGAKLWDRVERVARLGILYMVLMTGTLVLVVAIINRSAFALFLGSASAAVEIAHHVNTIVSWSFVLFGVSMIFAGVVRATGAVWMPLLSLVVSLWIVRLPFAYLAVPHWGPDAIWWSFPLGSLTSLVMMALYYRFGRWRSARMI